LDLALSFTMQRTSLGSYQKVGQAPQYTELQGRVL